MSQIVVERTIPIKITVNTGYLNEFLRAVSARDLLPMFATAKDPSKEITESMAAFLRVSEYLAKHVFTNGEDARSRRDILVFVPGDGPQARTSNLVVHRSRWTACAVDPLARIASEKERLYYVQSRIENYDPKELITAVCPSVVAVLSVHSHGKLEPFVSRLSNDYKMRTIALAIPCCVEQTVFNRKPVYKKKDHGILSTRNEVLLWDIKPSL